MAELRNLDEGLTALAHTKPLQTGPLEVSIGIGCGRRVGWVGSVDGICFGGNSVTSSKVGPGIN
jgi:hypothetical protein